MQITFVRSSYNTRNRIVMFLELTLCFCNVYNSTLIPDHTFLYVNTLYTVGGMGLSIKDKLKLAHPSLGCSPSREQAQLLSAQQVSSKR